MAKYTHAQCFWINLKLKLAVQYRHTLTSDSKIVESIQIDVNIDSHCPKSKGQPEHGGDICVWLYRD
jgi:hypothetical protein